MKVVKQMTAGGDIASLTLGPLHEGQHNHTQDFADRTKINKGVKDPLKAEVEKGYTPAERAQKRSGYSSRCQCRRLEGCRWVSFDPAGSLQRWSRIPSSQSRSSQRGSLRRLAGLRWTTPMSICRLLAEELLSVKVSVQRGEEISRAIVFAHRGPVNSICSAGIVQN